MRPSPPNMRSRRHTDGFVPAQHICCRTHLPATRRRAFVSDAHARRSPAHDFCSAMMSNNASVNKSAASRPPARGPIHFVQRCADAIAFASCSSRIPAKKTSQTKSSDLIVISTSDQAPGTAGFIRLHLRSSREQFWLSAAGEPSGIATWSRR